MNLKLIFTLLLFSFPAHAQKAPEISQYFDKYWLPVASSNEAAFYRTVEKSGKLSIVRDYFISGKLRMEAPCTDVTPKLIKNGKAVFYYENGTIEWIGTYKEDRETGLFHYYYEDGSMKREIFYGPEKIKYYQCWSADGKAQLVNGTGIITTEAKEKEEIGVSEIQDSVEVNSYLVNSVSSDTTHTLVDVPPKYKDGYEALMKDVGTLTHYPTDARRRGVQGTVYVMFVVDKSGTVKNPSVLRGIGASCDEAALQTVLQLSPWEPGQHRGKKVQVRFVLPIKFKLDGYAPRNRKLK